MKQREPGEPGRPNGRQDCPSPKHRLLWTAPKDIVRLCEPQPGQLHLGQAGPEDQVLSEWLKSATLPGAQARTGPGALAGRRKGRRSKITGSPFSRPG